MFGVKFIKAQPTTYLMAFKQGKAVRQGAGLSLLYYSPTTNLVAVPINSRDVPFMLEKVTADFQVVRVQGQVSYRIAEPIKAAATLNFSLNPTGKSYASDDPEHLPQRIIAAVEVLVQSLVQGTELKDAIRGAAELAAGITKGLKAHPEVLSLGIEILSVAVLAVKPTPETARALEAQAREDSCGSPTMPSTHVAIRRSSRNVRSNKANWIRKLPSRKRSGPSGRPRSMPRPACEQEAGDPPERHRSRHRRGIAAQRIRSGDRGQYPHACGSGSASHWRVHPGHSDDGPEDHPGACGHGHAARSVDRAGLWRHCRTGGADRSIEYVAGFAAIAHGADSPSGERP